MKNYVTKYTWIGFILCIAIFTSCEKDEAFAPEVISTSGSGSAADAIPSGTTPVFMQDLERDVQFQEIAFLFSLREVLEEAKQSGNGRSERNANGFSIDFNTAKKKVTQNKTSYIFLIERDIHQADTFENLVIEQDQNGQVRGYIIKWNERSDAPFDGDISVSPYSQNLETLLVMLNQANTEEL